MIRAPGERVHTLAGAQLLALERERAGIAVGERMLDVVGRGRRPMLDQEADPVAEDGQVFHRAHA